MSVQLLCSFSWNHQLIEWGCLKWYVSSLKNREIMCREIFNGLDWKLCYTLRSESFPAEVLSCSKKLKCLTLVVSSMLHFRLYTIYKCVLNKLEEKRQPILYAYMSSLVAYEDGVFSDFQLAFKWIFKLVGWELGSLSLLHFKLIFCLCLWQLVD